MLKSLKPEVTTPTEAFSGLALSQAINSIKSFGGMLFLAKRPIGMTVRGAIGTKSLSTS
jgi:hypothetical protein